MYLRIHDDNVLTVGAWELVSARSLRLRDIDMLSRPLSQFYLSSREIEQEQLVGEVCCHRQEAQVDKSLKPTTLPFAFKAQQGLGVRSKFTVPWESIASRVTRDPCPPESFSEIHGPKHAWMKQLQPKTAQNHHQVKSLKNTSSKKKVLVKGKTSFPF